MNELTPIERPLDAYRMSTDAAGACGEIVKRTAKPIQGRRYVSVEGWQAIAIAHGCAASSDHVERVNDEGMSGFKAIGFIRRMSDGAEIARAEGFLGDDEGTWAKRTVHARRAMVQTRAISRACRSAFAHVVVMIDSGLSTTPAEEMPAEGDLPPHNPQTGEIIEGEVREKVPGIHKIKERLRHLITSGSAATQLEAFNAMVHEHKDDLQKIKDANHEWWTGDGDDFEGFKAFIKRRREELTPAEESLTFQMLVSVLDECTSANELQGFLQQHGDAVETLDGAESRDFEARYAEKEAALKQLETVTSGS